MQPLQPMMTLVGGRASKVLVKEAKRGIEDSDRSCGRLDHHLQMYCLSKRRTLSSDLRRNGIDISIVRYL